MLVRYTFENPERAAAELRVALPPFVVAQVDWESLKAERNSVVDPELRETETDLLFSARLKDGRQVLFYVLLEHQSSVDRWMALRMLRYVVRQLEHWRQEHPGSEWLPIIIPLVMYHGPGGAWSAPRPPSAGRSAIAAGRTTTPTRWRRPAARSAGPRWRRRRRWRRCEGQGGRRPRLPPGRRRPASRAR